jgi:DNA-binding LacI/PurR family transcriptional regulator
MRALLALPEPPDAVFCSNDLLAVGALHTAAEHGLTVPDDLAVVDFDGSEEGAFSRPPLTTTAPDIAAIVEEAVALLARPARRPGADGGRHALLTAGQGEHGRARLPRTKADWMHDPDGVRQGAGPA